MPDEVMAYAARFPGMPGYGAVVVDDEHKRDTAKSVADFLRRGATVERVTIDAAREGMREYIAARRTKDAAEPKQAGLL